MKPLRYTLNTLNQNNLNQTVFMGNTIWKYLSIKGFEDFINNSRLKLTVLNKWQGGDPFEGTFDEKQLILRDGGNPMLSNDILGEPSLFSGYLDHMKIFQNKSNKTTKELKEQMDLLEVSAYAASFHINDEPNRYMLDNYGQVAVKTSTDTLEAELENSGRFFQTGRIEYITDSWTPIPEVFNSVMFYKLGKYINEREFRIFTIDKSHYDVNDPSTFNLYVNVRLSRLVNGVYINPALDANDRRRLRDITERKGLRVLREPFIKRVGKLLHRREMH